MTTLATSWNDAVAKGATRGTSMVTLRAWTVYWGMPSYSTLSGIASQVAAYDPTGGSNGNSGGQGAPPGP
jgi:alkylhydroperoxidase/carboxymuconolactone decarboxylase family protein YurZ